LRRSKQALPQNYLQQRLGCYICSWNANPNEFPDPPLVPKEKEKSENFRQIASGDYFLGSSQSQLDALHGTRCWRAEQSEGGPVSMSIIVRARKY